VVLYVDSIHLLQYPDANLSTESNNRSAPIPYLPPSPKSSRVSLESSTQRWYHTHTSLTLPYIHTNLYTTPSQS
jgi:hypothetical protein